MKTFITLVALILISTSVSAEHFYATVDGFDNLDVPEWMLGPISVELEYNGCHYTIIHIFQDTDLPRMIICQEEKNPRNLDDFLYLLKGAWRHDPAMTTGISHRRHNDILIYANFNKAVVHCTMYADKSANVDYNRELRKNVRYFYAEYDSDLKIRVHLKGDLPDWAKKNCPYELE